MDWMQLWEIVSKPDNVPIVLLMLMVPFYTWYGFRQARANDRLIDELSALDKKERKGRHRKNYEMQEGWDERVHVWPYLLRIEFLAALIVLAILTVWAIVLDAPLEEPANPNHTMNPSKAPWYFLGLQEMLVYFDPWIAGVVLPTLILKGLMVIPYIDPNPLGNGYYTWKQRRFSVGTFCVGFLVLWLSMTIIGTLIRGPGWLWFWPGVTWDHHKVVYEVNRDLHSIFGIESVWGMGIFGFVAVVAFFAVAGGVFHKLFTKYKPDTYAKMNWLQYQILQVLMIGMIALPVKMVLRLVFNIKYVWVTPWFNV